MSEISVVLPSLNKVISSRLVSSRLIFKEAHFHSNTRPVSIRERTLGICKDPIERFQSRDQRSDLLNGTKACFCITKGFNSQRTDLVHQYVRLFIV